LKRSLEILTEPVGDPGPQPRVLRAGDTTLMVFDEGDGSSSSRLASYMTDVGARQLDAERVADPNRGPIRIAIRFPALTAEARKRAAALEAGADVVLGSARPVFARRLVEALLGD